MAPLFEQGKVCATHLAQFGIGRYHRLADQHQAQGDGIDLFSAGNFQGWRRHRADRDERPPPASTKLVIQNDQLVGACMFGDTVDGGWYFKMMREGRKISDIRDKLMFGEAGANIGDVRPPRPEQGRHGRRRRGLRLQWREQGHHLQKPSATKGPSSLERCAQHTKASSCGSCTGPGRAADHVHAGGDYSAAPRKSEKASAAAPTHSHQDARDAIKANHLLTKEEVFRFARLAHPNGCPAAARPSTTT